MHLLVIWVDFCSVITLFTCMINKLCSGFLGLLISYDLLVGQYFSYLRLLCNYLLIWLVTC